MTPAYGLLARAMFLCIERLAGTDSKHGDRLRLESYAYFVTAISDKAGAVPVLQWHVRQAAAAKQRAMQAYVQQQLEHGKFWKLMEFSMVTLHRLTDDFLYSVPGLMLAEPSRAPCKFAVRPHCQCPMCQLMLGCTCIW